MVRTLTVPGRFDSLEVTCRFVAAAAEAAGLSDRDSAHCQLAVDEACTNIIEHGYGGEGRGGIRLRCDIEPGTLTITIRDQAKYFDPDSVPHPNLHAPLDEIRIGGLGLYFMRNVMDTVEFSYEDGGNKLVLVKRKSMTNNQ
jgi:anti-sigma regulatory factor (Ser/Thr protein kinase)